MRILKQFVLLLAMAATGAGITYAFFTAQGKVAGMSFSTANVDLQLSQDGTTWGKTLTGLSFTQILPSWSQNYSFILKNTGTISLKVNFSGSLPSYATTDTANLRNQIYLDLSSFVDEGDNGQWDAEALTPLIVNKTLGEINSAEGAAPIDLGQVDVDGIKGYLLTFSTESTLDGSLFINKTFGGYEFIFDGTP